MCKGIGIFFIALLFIASAQALQVKAVKNNQTVSAKISSTELSRIFVSGDRIQTTRGVNGVYELIKDEKQGVVFIKPTPFYHQKPFNLFVSTENGQTYNLLLIPRNIPAETIELKQLSPSIAIADKWEKNSAYVEILIRLINSMVNETHPEGFAVNSINGELIKFCGMTMQIVTLYKGNHLQAEIWCIKNCSKKTIHLTPSQFLQKNIRAISFENDVLESGDEAYVYKVIAYD